MQIPLQEMNYGNQPMKEPLMNNPYPQQQNNPYGQEQPPQNNFQQGNQGFDGKYDGELPKAPQDAEASYARLNNQYGPVSQDIRNSYGADFAADLNPLLQKTNSRHIRSLFAFLILWLGVGTLLALYFTSVVDLQLGALIGICVGIYIFYLILGLCCNPLLSYLSNIEHGGNFQKQYSRIQSMPGQFEFHAECYHYETRHHTRTVTDSNGNTKTEHYTTTQKVVTHTATEYLHPFNSKDQSGNVDNVRAQTNIIFVHYKVHYRFLDDQSRWRFDWQWQNFQSRHRFDMHQDYSQMFTLPGMQPRMTFYIGDQPKNYYCMLIVMSIFGMIWPYSMHVQSKVSRFDIQFMKILTI